MVTCDYFWDWVMRVRRQKPATCHFRVLLRRDDDEVRLVDIEALTRHLAARMAEAGNIGWRAEIVAVEWGVVGRCGNCDAFVFEDEERPRRSNRLRCADC